MGPPSDRPYEFPIIYPFLTFDRTTRSQDRMATDTKEKILQEARDQFVQNGFDQTRMQEIADAAGINKALLHYYYSSKEQLYEAVVHQIMDWITQRLTEALDQGGPFWDQVERAVTTYIDLLLEQPQIPLFMLWELSHHRSSFLDRLGSNPIRLQLAQQFLARIEAEVANGTIRAFPPNQLLLNILGLTIFPFLAKPVYAVILSIDEPAFQKLMEERKSLILDFLQRALAT